MTPKTPIDQKPTLETRPRMSAQNGRQQRASVDLTREQLSGRLRLRRAEIIDTINVRALAVDDGRGEEAPVYLDGLRGAIAAAVDYGIAAVELGAGRCGPVPVALGAQAREAARNRVPLETVLRRYLAGYTAVGDFLAHEAAQERPEITASCLHHLQRDLAALLDRILGAVSEDYRREQEKVLPLQARRMLERVGRLLAGDLIETGELDYDFDCWHLGLILTGPGASPRPRALASALDRRCLLADHGDGVVWAWLGGRREFAQEELDATTLACQATGSAVSVAVGEPARGLAGWRLSHRQAQVALAVHRRDPRPFIRYEEVALAAAVLRDEDLTAFLTGSFLTPLERERDGGEALRRTLRAYFAAGRNVASAAAALGVTRHTVTNRLRLVEKHICRSLDTCSAEIEIAVRLADLHS
jgi:hypothetical protein